MKVKQLYIKGIGGIDEINIDFNDNMNIICGPNGVGKTTILECIAHAFGSTRSEILKRNVAHEAGLFALTVTDNGKISQKTLNLNAFHPGENRELFYGFRDLAKNVIVFKTNRTFSYKSLQNIAKDSEKNDMHFGQEVFSGARHSDIKNWFIQRYLWSAHRDYLSSEQLSNLELAKKVFGLLSDEIMFSKIQPDTFDILVKNYSGDIYYEYLSSGYKSCLFVLLGLIKEIEIRYKNPYVKAECFKGLVLLDELDLHLHPEWQAKLLNVLKEVFPGVQFIGTTHSPHIIQAAEPKEIIALEFNNSKVSLRDISSFNYGFKGWSIDEILTDVMGMKSTKSEFLQEQIDNFFLAIDKNNSEEAQGIFLLLEDSLHPNNELRKLMKLHLSDLGVKA